MKTIFVNVCAVVARLLAVFLILTASRVLAQEVAGAWGGLLAGQLHIIFHLTKNADGHYSGSLESPDQGAFILQAENVEITKDNLGFSIPKLGGRYDGTWNAGQETWVGIWKQGQSLPLASQRSGPKRSDAKTPTGGRHCVSFTALPAARSHFR
jgi:uncharacterized protein